MLGLLKTRPMTESKNMNVRMSDPILNWTKQEIHRTSTLFQHQCSWKKSFVPFAQVMERMTFFVDYEAVVSDPLAWVVAQMVMVLQAHRHWWASMPQATRSSHPKSPETYRRNFDEKEKR